MSFVKDWTVDDRTRSRLNFKRPVRRSAQITDLLQFICRHRSRGHRHGRDETRRHRRLHAWPSGWSASASAWSPIRITGARSEPISNEVVLTIFSEDAAATAALESGAVDIIYGGGARSAVRLQACRLPTHPRARPAGPGVPHQLDAWAVPQCEVPPGLQLPDGSEGHPARSAMRGSARWWRLPWAPAGPAFDPSYNRKLCVQHRQGEGAARRRPGLSAAEMSDWKLLVKRRRPALRRDQPGGAGLARARQGSRSSSTCKRGRSSSTRC